MRKFVSQDTDAVVAYATEEEFAIQFIEKNKEGRGITDAFTVVEDFNMNDRDLTNIENGITSIKYGTS